MLISSFPRWLPRAQTPPDPTSSTLSAVSLLRVTFVHGADEALGLRRADKLSFKSQTLEWQLDPETSLLILWASFSSAMGFQKHELEHKPSTDLPKTRASAWTLPACGKATTQHRGALPGLETQVTNSLLDRCPPRYK